ncbi:MAG: S8 family peptidase [Clostridiales bacterium]|nr:S8 family peptidase [Clostridiales bacterium]
MTKANRRRIVFLFLLLSLLPFSFSEQRLRLDRGKKQEATILKRQIRDVSENWIRRERDERYAPGQVLVKFKPSLRAQLIDATLAAYETELIRRIHDIEVYQVQIPSYTSVEEMVFALNQNPDVEYAEPNYATRLAVTPNDSLFNYQYYLYNSGQEIGPSGSPRGKAQADIKATAAWEETKGSPDVLIAVIDTGVDLLHPDLKNKIHSAGRDFINNDFDATDDHGHGTIVASVAAAETNNKEGIAGVAWNSKILPVKVMDQKGEGYYSELISGIMWAVANGASVINLSLGGDEVSDSLRNALKYAYDKGVIIVAAAGNDASSVLYPAAYDSYCLAVAATDYKDERKDWSNFGTQVDVAAPGERVVGAVPTWFWGPDSFPYAFGTGTSLATPQVAGLAALLKGLKPWLSVDQVMDVIRYSADDVNSSKNPGKDNYIGFGRINMEKALVPIKIKK